MSRPAIILPVIVLAQLSGTSVWFAGNAVLPDLQERWAVEGAVAWITGAVQLGFILGTLASAGSGLADRLSPRWLFLGSALLAALFNAAVVLVPDHFVAVLALRFGTGVALAGIYPIGMKIAAGWYAQGLGGALGWLVGALVVGTALPHGIRALGGGLPWVGVLLGTSVVCALGGVLLAVMVPDGPHLRSGGRLDPRAALDLIRRPALRSAALGYLGHMWELYTFWALVPVILAAHIASEGHAIGSVSGWSFAIIAIGGATCVVGGLAARRVGSRAVAMLSLVVSGSCAVIAPWLLSGPSLLLLPFLLLWGAAVIPDSPQLSAMTARAAPPALVGSSLTLLNSAGFALTVVSLQVTAWLPLSVALPVLGLGPALGLVALVLGARSAPHASEVSA